MDQHERATWRRIEAHALDKPDAALPFTQRLARDNGWSVSFAARVVDEYRRFCFLAVHAGHCVTPSDEVDQVWHLHLTYSEDYWGHFCPVVLGAPLHHGPTRGGSHEGSKYRDWYATTLASYQRHFGQPPADIWPAVSERFQDADRFVRVHRDDVIMIDRRAASRVGKLLALVAGISVATAAAASTGLTTVTKILIIAGLGVVVIGVVGVVMAFSRGLNGDPHRKEDKESATGAGYGCGTSGSKADSGGGDGGCGGGCGGCGG